MLDVAGRVPGQVPLRDRYYRRTRVTFLLANQQNTASMWAECQGKKNSFTANPGCWYMNKRCFPKKTNHGPRNKMKWRKFCVKVLFHIVDKSILFRRGKIFLSVRNTFSHQNLINRKIRPYILIIFIARIWNTIGNQNSQARSKDGKALFQIWSVYNKMRFTLDRLFFAQSPTIKPVNRQTIKKNHSQLRQDDSLGSHFLAQLFPRSLYHQQLQIKQSQVMGIL